MDVCVVCCNAGHLWLFFPRSWSVRWLVIFRGAWLLLASRIARLLQRKSKALQSYCNGRRRCKVIARQEQDIAKLLQRKSKALQSYCNVLWGADFTWRRLSAQSGGMGGRNCSHCYMEEKENHEQFQQVSHSDSRCWTAHCVEVSGCGLL